MVSTVSRMAAADRRRQILDVARRALNENGVEGVHITAVAEEAGVSRPLLYRLFPSRNALVVALLEDFVGALDARFRDAVLRALPGSLDEAVRAFVEACCEAIDDLGAGPWRLLDARGVDPQLTRAGHKILGRLLAPWKSRIAEMTGLSPKRAQSLMLVVVAAGRTMLEGWVEGGVSRKQAVEDTTRVVTALLAEFAGRVE